MEYLNRVLGLKTYYLNDEIKPMPNYIYARYDLRAVTLDGYKVIFVYPKEELESINVVKKHLSRIGKTETAPVVLILKHMTYRQKEYLLRDHIPFVVDGKQIYLPFMAVYLQERGDSENTEVSTMLPSSQLLLLYYIYHGCGELMTSSACVNLGFTPTSISRASRQLEELGLVHLEKRGVQKVIYTEKSPKELFDSARGNLISPVKRTIYVQKSNIEDDFLLSGYSALSKVSMLNPPTLESRAAGSIAALEKYASHRLLNSEEQCAVELWRYDPKRLSQDDHVDRISLALALSGDKDERVEEAIEEMMKQVWRDINGSRH